MSHKKDTRPISVNNVLASVDDNLQCKGLRPRSVSTHGIGIL